MTTVDAALDFSIEPLIAGAASARPADPTRVAAAQNPSAAGRSAYDGLGLSDLAKVVLDPDNQRLLDHAATSCGGPASARNRKVAEARDALALGQLSGRLRVQGLDLREALVADVIMDVPVPVMDRDGQFHVAPQAWLGLSWPVESMVRPMPGYSFAQLLGPRGAWHANCSRDGAQVLCLGVSMPAGVRLTEIILAVYGALSMQNVQLDERDFAGVLNADAARWWQSEMHRIPLTNTPFLARA